ncbi:MAG: HD-GYP domain-containing protein [Herminiimonas sp.]|nr:HD-GYP domain-containing protein [Herminiimonas sp.]
MRQLGLNRIQIDPARSDTAPLAPVSAGALTEHAPSAVIAADSAAVIRKRERIARIAKQRENVVQCEAQFLKAATALEDINANLYSRPAAAHQSADRLIQKMLDSILIDKDIAIHLMNDKVAGEEMYFYSLNITVLAMMLARELGLPATDIKQLGIGCLFHDIGKLDIPDRVRTKTEPHTRAERNLMQQHCQYGVAMAAKLGLSRSAVDIIAEHHECVDGSGYPRQLKAGQIALLSRIVAIVNTYDNLCNQPNLLDSLSPYEALSLMFAQQRNQFDAGALTTFIRCMGVYPPGTLVRLSDDTLGMVVAVNSSKPLRPAILIYDAAVPKAEAIILDLMVEPDLHVTASLKPMQLPREVHEYLSPRKRTTYYFDSPAENLHKRQ